MADIHGHASAVAIDPSLDRLMCHLPADIEFADMADHPLPHHKNMLGMKLSSASSDTIP